MQRIVIIKMLIRNLQKKLITSCHPTNIYVYIEIHPRIYAFACTSVCFPRKILEVMISTEETAPSHMQNLKIEK